MRTHSVITTLIVGSVLAFSSISADTTPVVVLASNGIRAVIEDLAPQFERATTQKVTRKYDLAANLKRRIEGGEAFDFAVVTPGIADDLIKAGKLVAGTRTAIARSSLAVAIRSNGPRPDISTTDAFRRVLLGATAVAYAKEGASGAGFAQAMETLGITGHVRTMPTVSGRAAGDAVVNGTAEYAILPVSEILPIAGTAVLGPFPPQLRSYVVMVAGVSASASNATGAKKLLEFMMAPAATAVFTRRGMERVAP